MQTSTAAAAESNSPAPRARAARAVARSLVTPGLLWLAWVVLFQLMRLLLIGITNSHRGEATNLMLAQAAWHGLRFDFATATWLVVPFGLWWIWRTRAGRGERRWVAGIFAVVTWLAVFTLVAEMEFYKEFQMRLGPLAFEYFSTNEEHNAIILGMIWHGYPVVRWMLVCFALWAGLLWLTRRICSRSNNLSGWRARAAATMVLGMLATVSIRGGVRGAPLRWGDAYFSQNSYANQMTLNGLWAILDTAKHATQDNQESRRWLSRMPVADAVKQLREMVLLPGEKLVAPETHPLLRVSPSNGVLVKRPENVVLVMMESFTARFNDATGAGFGATPNFAELAREGILFDHAFSISTHTAPGVFGTLCSFPVLPDVEYVMKSPLGQQPFRSMPRIFSENGFETLFLYNGLFSWDNKEGFFRNQGIQRFIGRNDYVNPTFVDPDWGVCDHDVFVRAIEEFNALAARKQPFFSVVLTLSNHAPFNLPKVPGLQPVAGADEKESQRLSGVQYADWALGQFMKSARQQPWFSNTLFVFVGDHGFGIAPNITDLSLLHMHVPLLFYAPELMGGKHEVRHEVAGHLDILPSIIGLMGFDTPHQAFGRDLFRLPAGDGGQTYVKRSGDPIFGWIEGNEVFAGSVVSPPSFHRFDLGFPPQVSADLRHEAPERTAAMNRKLNAMVVTGLDTLRNRRAAPRSQKLVPLGAVSGG